MSGRLPDWNRHQCYVVSDGKEFFNGINIWLGKKSTTKNPLAAALYLAPENAQAKLDRMRSYYLRLVSSELADAPLFVRNAQVYVMTVDVSLKKC